MPIRDQLLNRPSEDMHLQLRCRAVAATSTFRSTHGLLEIFRDSPLQNCFVLTHVQELRMTDPAFFLLTELFVIGLASERQIRDQASIRSTTVAMMSYGWMHRRSEIPATPADLVEINRVLNIVPPALRDYLRYMNSYVMAVRNLQQAVGADHPYRAQYHYLQLHYIPRTMVGEASRAVLQTMCDCAQPADIANVAAFDVELLDEPALALAWRALSIEEKVRWFEFCTRVEGRASFDRCATFQYGGVISISKGGAATDEWVTRRIEQLRDNHSINIDPRIITPELVTRVYNEFVVKAGLKSKDLFNYLRVWYHMSHISNLESVKWIIEQTSLVGASAVTMIADTVLAWGIRLEVLLAAGIPLVEVQAFAEAVCWLERDRLSSILHPRVESAKYRTLLAVCKNLSDNPAYRNLQTGGILPSAVQRVAVIIGQHLREFTISRMGSALDPITLARSCYNVTITENAGVFTGAAAVGPGAAAGVVIRGNTAMDVLSRIPPTARDRAFITICETAQAAGAQTNWTLLNRGQENTSPYRVVPRHVVTACATLGFTWRGRKLRYFLPVLPYAIYIQAAWDLGCYGGNPIPNPARGRRPPDGPGGDNDDDDNSPWRPYRCLTAIEAEQVFRGTRAIGDFMPNVPRGAAGGPAPPEDDEESEEDDDDDDQHPGGGGAQQDPAPNNEQPPPNPPVIVVQAPPEEPAPANGGQQAPQQQQQDPPAVAGPSGAQAARGPAPELPAIAEEEDYVPGSGTQSSISGGSSQLSLSSDDSDQTPAPTPANRPGFNTPHRNSPPIPRQT